MLAGFVASYAAAREASEIASLLTPGAGLYSTSRTCELGVGRATKERCHSLVHLVREALLGWSERFQRPTDEELALYDMPQSALDER